MPDATVTYQFDARDDQFVRAMVRMTEHQREVALAAGRAAREGKAATGSFEGFGKSLDSVAMSTVKAVAGFASITAGMAVARRAIEDAIASMERWRKLQQEDLQTGVGVGEAVLPLADQLGDVSQAGQRRAATISLAMLRAGGLANFKVAGGVAQAAYGNFALMPETVQFGIAQEVAGFIGRTGGSPEEAGAISEFLFTSGVRTPQQARKLLAELDATVKFSATQKGGAFGAATVRGGVPMLVAGATPQEAMARTAQARAVSGASDDAAAELLRQVFRQVSSNEAREYVTEYSGVDWRQLSPNQMLDVLGQIFNDPSQQDKREKIFKDSREREQLTKLFAPAALEVYRGAMQAISRTDLAGYQRFVEGFTHSNLAIERRVRAEIDYGRFVGMEPAAIRDKIIDEEMRRYDALSWSEKARLTGGGRVAVGADREVYREMLDRHITTGIPELDAAAARRSAMWTSDEPIPSHMPGSETWMRYAFFPRLITGPWNTEQMLEKYPLDRERYRRELAGGGRKGPYYMQDGNPIVRGQDGFLYVVTKGIPRVDSSPNLEALDPELTPESFKSRGMDDIDGRPLLQSGSRLYVHHHHGDVYVNAPEPVAGRHPNEPEVP